MTDAPRVAEASEEGAARRPGRSWNDSPWLWGVLFAVAAVAAALAVAPRHAERQTRLVRMHEARQRVAAERAGAVPTATDAAAAASPAKSTTSAATRTGLGGLLGFLAAALLVTLAGLGWTLARGKRAAARTAGAP